MLEDMLNADSRIFKNQDIFNINHVPETIQCRDDELKNILMNIKPLVFNNKSLNTIIIGDAGTGKTTVLKKALQEIEEHTTLTTCYINCNIQDTIRKCYFQMYKVLCGYEARANISTEIIQEGIMNKLEEQSFVLAIDDINALHKKESSRLVNELFRLNEFYHANMSIILTANDSSFKSTLERNAYCILVGNEIEFKNYTSDQIYLILKHRCELGFEKGVIKKKQIETISEYIAANSTLRTALSVLNLLGQKLELEDRQTVTDQDISQMIEKIDNKRK